MRYQEQNPPEAPQSGVNPGMMAGTAAYTLLLGIAFVAFGRRVRKRWVTFWGVTMVIAGSAYLAALLSGV